MKASFIDYKDTHCFSQTLLAYIDRDPAFEPFITGWPDLESFGKQIELKANHPVNRKPLVDLLEKQYGGLLESSPLVSQHIKSLGDDRTFTVTTGHQLNIFTGPLYFIFKIISAIRLAEDLKKTYSEYNFVPVYWMASEDHDLAEINHTYLLSQKLAWDTPAVSATGRMATASMKDVVRTYQGYLGLSGHAVELSALVQEAYLENDNLAAATRTLAHGLFKKYGLVILDADDPALKQEFAPIIAEDIFNEYSHKLVGERSQELVEAGFSTQISGRPINFFYLTDTYRERLVYENGYYQVLDQDIGFSREELAAEIRNHPERFSPNVVMRPLYQELVLPNLAYIGGGAEIVYWLQLKSVFDHYHIPFPLLVPRNSALVTEETLIDKVFRLDWEINDVFRPVMDLKREYIHKRSQHTLDLQDEWKELSAIFSKIKLRAHKIDATLGPSTEAVQARLKRAMHSLEKKLLKAEMRNHADAVVQIERIKEKLFPNGGLQERSENFGLLYVKYGEQLLDELHQHFRPLDFKFTVLY